MDTYVLLKNGSVIYEGENDPRAGIAKDAAAAPAGPSIGGFSISNPTGAAPAVAKDDSDAANNGPPSTDPFLGAWVTLQDVDSTASLKGTVPVDGKYQVEVSEQYDQKMTLSQDTVATKTTWTPVPLKAGAVQIDIVFNPNAVTPDVIASRQAAGLGVSKSYYRIVKVG